MQRSDDEFMASIEELRRSIDEIMVKFEDFWRTTEEALDESFAEIEKQQQEHFDRLDRLLIVSLTLYNVCQFLTISR